MYFVYLLKSKKTGKLYIGYTDDLRRRLNEHNNGKSKATKPYAPWKLKYYEAYSTKEEAIKREQNLKLRANAWNQLNGRIKQSLDTD